MKRDLICLAYIAIGFWPGLLVGIGIRVWG